MDFEWIDSITGDWKVKLLLVLLATTIIQSILVAVLKNLAIQLEKTKILIDDAVIVSVRKPLISVLWIIAGWGSLQILSAELHYSWLDYRHQFFQAGILVSIGWFSLSFVGVRETQLISLKHERDIDETLVSAIANISRLVIWVLVILLMMQVLGITLSAVLTFGGIGGAAIAFASKDLLSNFFGALMIHMDRPFKVGDWVRSPDKSIEGTVEKIGWRQTIVRTFDKRPLYVPNSIFTTIVVENPSRMSHRRIYETVGIRYQDMASVEAIVKDVEAMLRTHSEIAQDQTLMVNFNAFSSSSLDFFIYTFTKTTNWIKYHDIKQDILLKVADIIESHHAQIAFPSRSVYLESMPGLEKQTVPLGPAPIDQPTNK